MLQKNSVQMYKPYLWTKIPWKRLNAPNDALAGAIKQQHPMRPIVWEQTRNEQDAYYCENNIITTNIVGCASNSSQITSTTSGEATEEYMSKYMVKEKFSLKQAVPSLLAVLDEIIVHSSKAEDTCTAICTGKHLTQCTVNAFSGSHQWSMPSWHWLSWVTDPSSAQNCTAMSSHMQMSHT
jgi:hypothetical protein